MYYVINIVCIYITHGYMCDILYIMICNIYICVYNIYLY